jgi:hypothetical protein
MIVKALDANLHHVGMTDKKGGKRVAFREMDRGTTHCHASLDSA